MVPGFQAILQCQSHLLPSDSAQTNALPTPDPAWLGSRPLGEDSVEAQPIKDALKKAREQTRVQPVGERLDSTLKFIQRARARIEKLQSELSREQSLLQGALENLERLRDEAATSVTEPVHRPSVPMVVEDPGEEVQRLRAQVCRVATGKSNQTRSGREPGRKGPGAGGACSGFDPASRCGSLQMLPIRR